MEQGDDLSFFQAGHWGTKKFEQERRSAMRQARRRAAATPQAQILRGYIVYKTFEDRPDRRPPHHLDDLNMLLIAAVNAAAAQQVLDWLDKIGTHVGDSTLRRELERLRERGKKVLAEYPELGKPEPGLPRGIRLAIDPEPETEEPELAETVDIDLDDLDFGDVAPPKVGV